MAFPELKNKIVLVIGGAQGIGKEVCRMFALEQATVIDADYQYDGTLQSVDQTHFQAFVDVREESSVIELVEQLQRADLVPDILVHVAGISTMDFLLESQTEDFDQVLAVNRRGAYLACTYVVRAMKQRKKAGRVIIVASQAGKNAYRGMSPYVASKHAVLGLTKNLALEVAKDQILVNAVCPGIIETEMKWRERAEGALLRGMTPEEVLAEDQSQVPLGRTGQPKDVGNVVLFLASDLSSYVTGQAINITGGMTMN